MKKKVAIAAASVCVFFGGIVAGAAVQSDFFTDAQQTISVVNKLFDRGNQYKNASNQLQAQLDQNKSEIDSLRHSEEK